MILAGDVGGTHTRLAFFEGGKQVGTDQTFPSRDFQSLEEIVKKILPKHKIGRACFGIAGPVREGRCEATNLPWIIDARAMERNLGIEQVDLLNDLEANAHGIAALQEGELFLLQKGAAPHPKGNRALISAGTGLGEAGLYWNGSDYFPFASEGGHADFAPRTQEEWELFTYLQKKWGHVSYERVVSGPALTSIFEFLIEEKGLSPSPEVQREVSQKNSSLVISEWGKGGRDPVCAKALHWFLSLYGAEAGNVALKFLALGGVYLGGGIIPHLTTEAKGGDFLSSFANKGRFKSLLETIPVWIILNDRTALLGAARFGEKR